MEGCPVQTVFEALDAAGCGAGSSDVFALPVARGGREPLTFQNEKRLEVEVRSTLDERIR